MKKPRNKKYTPRESRDPTQIFGGMSGDHAAHLQRLNCRNHAAMAAMATGAGTRAHWDLLVGAINMANVMCEQGIGNEFRQATIAGRDAMCSSGKRAVTTGRFAFSGDELQVMNEALACHDAQLENVRAIDVERAAEEVMRRIRHGANTTSVQEEMSREAAAA